MVPNVKQSNKNNDTTQEYAIHQDTIASKENYRRNRKDDREPLTPYAHYISISLIEKASNEIQALQLIGHHRRDYIWSTEI